MLKYSRHTCARDQGSEMGGDQGVERAEGVVLRRSYSNTFISVGSCVSNRNPRGRIVAASSINISYVGSFHYLRCVESDRRNFKYQITRMVMRDSNIN